MPRINGIWYRKDTGWWKVTFAGRRVRLVEGRHNLAQAERKFHELKAVTPQALEQTSVLAADIIEAFLNWFENHLSPESHRNLRWYGKMFRALRVCPGIGA